MDSLSSLLNPSEIAEILEGAPPQFVKEISETIDYLMQPSTSGQSFVAPDSQTNIHEIEINGVKNNEDSQPPPTQSNMYLDSENFAGLANFSYELINNRHLKCSWEYSEKINMLFIDINKICMVKFHVDTSQVATQELYIRATPIFDNYLYDPINRCTRHWIEDDPLNNGHAQGICRCTNYNLAGHVVRSPINEALHTYDPNTLRHSVLIPVDISQVAVHNSFNAMYSFACKNSCQKGMRRRSIHVEFTLETYGGNVLGKCSLAVKICSCPKRDKERLENDFELKSSSNSKRKGILRRKIQDKPEDDERKRTCKDEIRSLLRAFDDACCESLKIIKYMDDIIENSDEDDD